MRTLQKRLNRIEPINHGIQETADNKSENEENDEHKSEYFLF